MQEKGFNMSIYIYTIKYALRTEKSEGSSGRDTQLKARQERDVGATGRRKESEA